MKDLFNAARQLQYFLDSHQWKSCLIGGLAVQRWGEPRLTRDVDATLLTGFGNEEMFVDQLLAHYESRVDDARQFALSNRVMLLKAEDGTDIDLALGGLPFEERAVGRATDFEFYPGMTLRTCSAEDLLVMKAFAAREQDWGDVKGVIARQDGLDWDTVFAELDPLAKLKGAPATTTRLRELRDEWQGGNQ